MADHDPEPSATARRNTAFPRGNQPPSTPINDFNRNRTGLYGGLPETRETRSKEAGMAHPRMNRASNRGRGPKNYMRSDVRIQDDVNARLTDDGLLDASDVEVRVDDCEVTLSGHVFSRHDKRRAEDIAYGVSGVSHVQNNLRVRI